MYATATNVVIPEHLEAALQKLLKDVVEDCEALRSRFPEDNFIVTQQLAAQSHYRLNKLINELSQNNDATSDECAAIAARLGQLTISLVAQIARAPMLQVVK